MIRILLADQTEIVRYAISRVLRESMDNIFIKEVANVQQLVEQLHLVSYDLIITAFLLPGRSMLDIIPEMRKLHPGACILVISDLTDDVYAVRVIKAGAVGLLQRTAGIADLVSAVKKVLAGQKYLSQSVTELLLGSHANEKEKFGLSRLSNQEFDILILLASGHRVAQIAKVRPLSIYDIRLCRTKIMQKLRLKTHDQLLQYAIARGLVIVI